LIPSPSVTFGFILATLYGAGFHLLFGGDARRLALFLLASWLGFTLGHIFGVLFAVEVLSIGPLHTLSATSGALLALFAARFLTVNRPEHSDE
jgi:hypothetical protein